jgi:hypothetical protein
MFKEYEMVRIIRDIPELNLQAGDVGVVVIIYDEPNLPRAYEVDFSNIKDKELKTATLYDKDLERLEDL